MYYTGSFIRCDRCGKSLFARTTSAAEVPFEQLFIHGEQIELCNKCAETFRAVFKAFKKGITYRIPEAPTAEPMEILIEEGETNGPEQSSEEQSTFDPVDTYGDSLERAKAIRDAGGDRCQGLQT